MSFNVNKSTGFSLNYLPHLPSAKKTSNEKKIYYKQRQVRHSSLPNICFQQSTT